MSAEDAALRAILAILAGAILIGVIACAVDSVKDRAHRRFMRRVEQIAQRQVQPVGDTPDQVDRPRVVAGSDLDWLAAELAFYQDYDAYRFQYRLPGEGVRR